MAFETITLALSGDVAVLTLNQPASRNGLTEKLQNDMLAALDALAAGDAARALIVTGAGLSFCSGADLGRLDSGQSNGESFGNNVAKWA